MRKYDLLVTDFDGTLGKAPDYVEPCTVEAVKKFTESGGKFAICTGRIFSSIMNICRKYDFEGIVISYQGADINDIKTGKSLFSGGMSCELAVALVNDLAKEKSQTVVEADDMLVFDRTSPYVDYYQKVVGVKGLLVDNLAEYVKKRGRPVQKINAVSDTENIKIMTKKYSEKYKGKLIFNNGSDVLFEAVSPDCTKGKAVEFLSNFYKIPYDRILSVGDSTNDIELLAGKWRGVAVGDAKEELKTIADEVTVPYNMNPIKVLIEKYCL